MQQIATPARERSRRFPPRRRAIDVPEAPAAEGDDRTDALGARMDRLEGALRLVARANKEVLRTLDPRFDGRAELATIAERLSQVGAAVEGMRADVGRTTAEAGRAADAHDEVRREIEALRSTVEDLARRFEESAPPPLPRPVTRLADVRTRLARVSEELGDRSASR